MRRVDFSFRTQRTFGVGFKDHWYGTVLHHRGTTFQACDAWTWVEGEQNRSPCPL